MTVLGMTASIAEPSRDELEAVFRLKCGAAAALGWSPAMRQRFGYFTPDEWYEALLSRLVREETSWCDVGCGRHLFPSNAPLARLLAGRCRRLVGIDPDATIEENPYLHEKLRVSLDAYESEQPFDLVTLRMVAEHVEDPPRAVASLSRLVAPGGFAVIYTVHAWSPVPILTRCVPFVLHQPIKRWLWRTEGKDTFPTRFRMNTRRTLQRLLAAGSFCEAAFLALDDCRTFGRFRPAAWLELLAWRALRSLGLRYPESCLLGVYRRVP